MLKFSKVQIILASLRKALIKLRCKTVKFGKNVYIGRNCAITGIYSLELKNDIYIGKNVTIEVEGTIGSGVLIANNVGIVGRRDHDVFSNETPAFFARGVREDKSLSLPTHIGDGSWIGYGAIIMSGVTLGRNCIVASGSVVTKDIPENAIAGGNPARILSFRTTPEKPIADLKSHHHGRKS